ncbi:MAG: AarF/ABC1/UbiB kinase family protein [Chloroflexi bacterium]|nr:AarF/ABC1/UbiB kinase family protein [Chloroflexota bacterium]
MAAPELETPSHRLAHVRPAVSKAVTRWREQRELLAQQHRKIEQLPLDAVLKSMPRREQNMNRDVRQFWLPYIGAQHYDPIFWKSLARLLTWLGFGLAILLGNLSDRLLKRDSVERRAVRMRQALEKAGGTFVKLGQQLAMRIDLVTWAYCVELSRMLDHMTPFSSEAALQIIERSLQRRWQDVFAVFDPQPVGSASIACVFQAVLKNQERVVVKVRRPGIIDLFRADLQVLDWLCGLAELLTIIRPGFTRNLRIELRETLMEELDFRREGRFQDIFRRNAPASGRDFFSAPRVYFELSTGEVLVQEFVSGLMLWEVIALAEKKTPQARALLRKLNIDPAIVARRILWSAFWSMDEHVFFHADPHPANMIIHPDNKITFIDFGSCGSFNNQQKIALEQMVMSMKDGDVESMTRASLGLMEPMPPVDIPALVKQAQGEYMRVLHTFNTPARYTQYWERTSARQWFVLIGVAQKFNLPMNLHMLRMIRATLLYDSIVLRLDNQLDRYQEYTLFMRDRAQLVKKRWRENLRDSSGDNFFLSLDEFGKTLNNLMIRTQTTLGRPLINLGSTVTKWAFAASVISRMLGRMLLITILGMLMVAAGNYFGQQPISFFGVIATLTENLVYQLFVAASLVINTRHILFRLLDKDS